MMADWDVTSEAPIAAPAVPASSGGDSGWDVAHTDKFKFSDDAIKSAINTKGSTVVYMSPKAYLSLTPDLPDNPKTDKKGASLKKSLDKGDEVDEVPSLDVNVGKDGTAKVVDQDGRHRALFAQQNGLDQIPVRIQHGGQQALIKTLAGMKDGSDAVPFNFKPVLPPIDNPPPKATAKGAPRWDVLGDIGRAGEAAGKATIEDLKGAFPDPRTMKLDPISSVKRMGNVIRAPFDAASVLMAPVMGATKALAGSAIAAGLDKIPIPAHDGQPAHDPKADADDLIDQAMFGIGPEGMGGGAAGIRAIADANQTASAGNTLLKTAQKDDVLRDKALAKIKERMAGDGLTAQDVLDKQKVASASGDKMTLLDIGKKNVQGLGGAVHRAPGPAGAEIDKFFDDRDKAVSDALTSDIHGGIAKGSTFDAMKGLFAARTFAAKPAFDAAFESGSMVPFEKQLEGHFNDADQSLRAASEGVRAANSDLTSLEAKAATTSDVYSAPTPKELQEARAKVETAQSAADAAEANKEAVRTKLKQAQADGTANAPGAVWSPRLQEFMDNPEIQSGLKKALKLEKQDAVSERRPFKDSDFGIVGTDEHGDPIIGAVPTMKSLAVAKEGLDARIADLKDPVTGRPTKAGLSLKKFRDEYVKELYRLNPKYKVAVDAWSGPSQSVDAINEGKQHFSRPESNEQIKSEFNSLTSSDKEFYRLGAAEAKIDALERTPDSADKSKRVINSERDRKRFRMLFDSDADAQKFIDSVERKRTMFNTKSAIRGGSQTAGRLAEDEHEKLQVGIHAAHGAAHALSGNVLGAVSAFIRAKRDLGLINNPELNSHIARILTDPNVNFAPSSGTALLNKTPLPGVQNQIAKGVHQMARVNGLRTMVNAAQAAAAQRNSLAAIMAAQKSQPTPTSSQDQ